MKNITKSLTLLFSALLFATNLLAQEEMTFFNNINEEEQKSIDALVMYPEDTRLAILEVSQNPGLLIKMNKLQEQSDD